MLIRTSTDAGPVKPTNKELLSMFDRFSRRSRVAIAGLALCGGLSGVVLVGSGGPAYAGTATGRAANTKELAGVSADSSGLYLDTIGGGVFQDEGYGGASQEWYVPAAGHYGRIKNYVYNTCITTDGVAGDELYLRPCTQRYLAAQTWYVQQDAPGYNFSNPHFGLVADVYGNSSQSGAPIDGWPYNGQFNQWFQLQVVTG
jgi:hypothetical protein